MLSHFSLIYHSLSLDLSYFYTTTKSGPNGLSLKGWRNISTQFCHTPLIRRPQLFINQDRNHVDMSSVAFSVLVLPEWQ